MLTVSKHMFLFDLTLKTKTRSAKRKQTFPCGLTCHGGISLDRVLDVSALALLEHHGVTQLLIGRWDLQSAVPFLLTPRWSDILTLGSDQSVI